MMMASPILALLLFGGTGEGAAAPDLGAFAPLPEVMDAGRETRTAEKIALGRMLYFDQRLSRNRDVSCNSCHPLHAYGVDGERFSTGHEGKKGGRNAPTVYNAAGHFAQFWDGRAPTIEEQAKGPVLHPSEMAMPDAAAVEAVLASIPGYVAAFRTAFPDERKAGTFEQMAEAIGAFERGLVTPSRWDRYLKRDTSALRAKEKQGLSRFVETGCGACHLGPYLGGAMFQRLGLAKSWPDGSDGGRFAVTGNESDRMLFKVPSLRNIEKTAPYFHDGSVARLEEAVRLMADYQIDVKLSDRDVEAIVAWMHSLTGEPAARYVQRPKLPPEAAASAPGAR
jgi:cytochrome c peroxidase